ncbi:hypothetical protein PVAP13_1NG373900 [Panicum virgatum]|uniref:Uncharacterized protein n=1 Tax=Panicum virgatum TaxID=38727 RepID=A0A8T0X5X9_PANVG|nr:hypothetical protein PVAP13_1NG373900 [Panicum virgatum]
MAEEHAAGSSSKKAASARGGPPAAGSSRRRPTATPPAAPPAERPQGWGRGPSLPCLFLLPRSSQGTPKEHRRKLFAGSLVPNHHKLSRGLLHFFAVRRDKAMLWCSTSRKGAMLATSEEAQVQ